MSIFSRLRKARDATTKRAELTGSTPKKVRLSRIGSLAARWFYSDYTLKNSELLFAAVSRISNSLASMPVQLYKGSNRIMDDLNDLIGFSPNSIMTSTQFFRTMEACRCATGNAYALKILAPDMSLARLDILDPARVQPVIEEGSGELWYRIFPDRGAEYYVHNFYMIHLTFISTNGYEGVNPVSVLCNTLSYNAEIQKFSSDQLKKGVNAQIVLEAPANLGEEQKKGMIEDFMDTYHETGGNILLLESGVQAKTLNLSPIDSKIFEVEKISRSRVAMVYNIPPHLLGDYSDTSFASQEQQMIEFLTFTMLPIVTAYEQELNKKLLSREQRKRGMAFRFSMDAVLRADSATQAEVNYKEVRSAISTPDEIRASKGRSALPNGAGRKAMISKDMAPLEGLLAYYAANPDKITNQGGKPNGENA